MSDGVKVNIQVSGADQAAAAVDDVVHASQRLEGAQDGVAQQVGSASKELEQLQSRATDAADSQDNFARKATSARGVLEGLGAAAAGGVRSFAGLGKAFDDALRTIGLSGKWIGMTSTIGAVIAVGQQLIEMFASLKQEGVAAAERIRTKWEAVRGVLAARREETFSTQLEAIRRAAAEALAEVDALARARDRLASAEMAAELAVLEGDDSITPEEKRVKELEIRGRYAIAEEERRMALIPEAPRQAREQYQNTRALRMEEEARMADIAAQLQRFDDERASIAAEIAAAELQAATATGDGESGVARFRINQALMRRAAIESPQSLEAEQALREQLDFRGKSAEAARREEQAAEAAAVRAERAAELERMVQTKENESAAVVRSAGMTSAVRARDSAAARAAGQASQQDAAAQGSQRIGAADQVIVDRVVQMLVEQMGVIPQQAAAGQLGRAGGQAADAARNLIEKLSPMRGEATFGEFEALTKAIEENFGALGKVNTAEMRKIQATVRGLERMMQNIVSQASQGRNVP